jgi:hypothetical protein
MTNWEVCLEAFTTIYVDAETAEEAVKLAMDEVDTYNWDSVEATDNMVYNCDKNVYEALKGE